MSFGVGVTDILEALQLLRSTYQAWRDAPRKYRTTKQRLRALQGPLRQLAKRFHEFERDRSVFESSGKASGIFASVEEILDTLESSLDKRKGLKLWDRLRIGGSGEIDTLNTALDRHVQDLTLLCCSLGFEDLRGVRLAQEALLQSQRDLKHGQDELRCAVEEIMLLLGATRSIAKAQARSVELADGSVGWCSKRKPSLALPCRQLVFIVALQQLRNNFDDRGFECEPPLADGSGKVT